MLAAPVQTGSLSATEVTGCNIYKNGADPPILPDSEYPDWLWKLATPDATLRDLERTGPDNLDMDEVNFTALLKCWSQVACCCMKKSPLPTFLPPPFQCFLLKPQ